MRLGRLVSLWSESMKGLEEPKYSVHKLHVSFKSLDVDIMNDESQRDYVRAIKRLITYSQKKYPTIFSNMVRS